MDRLYIFDTTLRDGEQSPGCSMNLDEKLRVAHALAVLGVDIIEAGFPVASPGDFEAVHRIAKEVHGPTIAGLSPSSAGAGQSVVISGSGFYSPNGQVIAYFGGTSTGTTCGSTTACTVTVPNLGTAPTTVPVTITTTSGTSNTVTFHYT